MAEHIVFKKKLEQERERIQKQLSDISQQNPNSRQRGWDVKKQEFSTDGPLDLESETDEVEDYINRMPLETQLEAKLMRINKALERIKNKSYGVCLECAKKMPKKRLDTVPEAEFCIECQK